jgi:hypothetical protein
MKRKNTIKEYKQITVQYGSNEEAFADLLNRLEEVNDEFRDTIEIAERAAEEHIRLLLADYSSIAPNALRYFDEIYTVNRIRSDFQEQFSGLTRRLRSPESYEEYFEDTQEGEQECSDTHCYH